MRALKHILLVVIWFHTVNVSNQKGVHFNIRLSLLNMPPVCGMEPRFILIKTLALVGLIYQMTPFTDYFGLDVENVCSFRMKYEIRRILSLKMYSQIYICWHSLGPDDIII